VTPFLYSIHARAVASDCELPFLQPLAGATITPDLVLRLGSAASGETPGPLTRWYQSEPDEDGASIAIDRTPSNELVMSFADGTTFHVGAGVIRLLAAPPQYTSGDLAAYALGPVLALALHLAGATLLHASAVVLCGKAVLFAGPSGSGKSTMAAMLHNSGYPVLSDDLTEVSGESLSALPSLPALRLWPEAVAALYGAGAEFPDRAPSWDKKIVSTVREGMETRSYEIAAVLFLQPRIESGPRLERLDATEAWKRLIANSYTARLPDRSMSRSILDMTTALADRVAMYTFSAADLAAAGDAGAFLERSLAEHLR
jgi:hypothetical protein